MIKHIVMWQLKEEAEGKTKEDNALLIKEKLESLRGRIEGLQHIEVGVDFLGGTNFDVVLYAELKDRKSLNTYQEHPLHQAVLPFVKAVVSERKAVDYEV